MANPLAFTVLLMTALSVVTYINVTHHTQRALTWLTASPPVNGSKYDFIVVGSGSSGSVVAGRLAEAGSSVLLVEAGGPAHWLMGLGAFAGYFLESNYDWAFKYEPSKIAQRAMRDSRGKVPRGKVLGGSSMLNFMAYVRGHRRDFDEWEELGNPGWGYKDVLEYFKKSEDIVIAGDENNDYHGKGGPITIQEQGYQYQSAEVLSAALEELGLEQGNINGKLQGGGFTAKMQTTQKDGWREGTYKQYVEPLLGRAKLNVATYATATKLIFDGTRCVGVEVERFGQTLRYFSDKETVVSAGAIGSPQLLMLSGVGPRRHLEEFGITLVKDLQVGQNLQDHCLVLMSLLTEKSGMTTWPFAILNPINYVRAFFGMSNPLSALDAGPIAFIRTSAASDGDPRPDLQLLTVTSDANVDFGLGVREGWNMRQDSYENFFAKYADKFYGLFAWPTLLHPKSRGSVKLKSDSIHDPPLIDPGYLTHPDDLKTLIAGAKFVRSIVDTEAARDHGLTLAGPDKFSCPNLESDSDAYWDCYVRHWLGTVFHVSGTCKMGPDSDAGAVVDHRLRVRGLTGLRVADASIMPRIVGANTHAACVMIGEKAADMIIEDWEDEAFTKKSKIKETGRDEL